MQIKPVLGFEDTHIVTSTGVIYVLPRLVHQPNHPFQKTRLTNFRALKPGRNKKGYLKVILNSGDGKQESAYVHRVVAKAFIKNINNKSQINHKNMIKSCNDAFNLEWVTNNENQAHWSLFNKMAKGV